MKIIEVKQDFKFADKGIYVSEFAKGDIAGVSDECADLAVAERWAKESTKRPDYLVMDGVREAPEQAVEEAAPESVAAAGAAESVATVSAPETK